MTDFIRKAKSLSDNVISQILTVKNWHFRCISNKNGFKFRNTVFTTYLIIQGRFTAANNKQKYYTG